MLHLIGHVKPNKLSAKVLNPLPYDMTPLTCDGAAASVRSILLRVEVLSILRPKLVLDITLPCNATFIHCYWRNAHSKVSAHLP